MIAFWILYSGATCWSKTGASSIWREGRAVRRSKGIERRIEQRFCFRFSIGGRTNRKRKWGATNTERERKEKTPIFRSSDRVYVQSHAGFLLWGSFALSESTSRQWRACFRFFVFDLWTSPIHLLLFFELYHRCRVGQFCFLNLHCCIVVVVYCVELRRAVIL